MKSNGSMNRFYRVVWNAATGVWQAVSERAKGQGKTKSSRARAVTLSGLAAGSFVLLPAAAFAALPTGGQIVAGSGSINQSGNTMTITQDTGRMAADWQSFSIGKGNTVNFVQPSASAVALNRVLGSDVSLIQGALNANGQVFLVNPNGVLFTPSAQVNVGALVASTLNLSTEDFMQGDYAFSGDSTASINNQGQINIAEGGSVALIAARIENTGTITAPRGNVLLGAGNKVRLDLGGPVKIEVEQGAIDALIEQGGAIRADAGLVYLTAKAAGDLASSVINHTGITEARSLASNAQGEIYLMGDMAAGSVQVAGTLDTSTVSGDAVGFIETSAHKVKVADGTQIKTADWLIDPTDFTISAGSSTETDSGIGASTLASALNSSSSVTIETTASGSGNGDIFVNDAVTWNNDSQLTLSAHRNIEINADITAEHTNGKLQLEYGQGAVTENNTASYNLNNGAKVNLQAGDNFATKLGNDGAVTEWKVITTLGEASDYTTADNLTLQGRAHSSELANNFVLGADIDAGATSDWNSGEGFTPIGTRVQNPDGTYDYSAAFKGSVDGLGHTISNLSINRPDTDDVGLFGAAHNTSINNLALVDANITGHDSVGGLVGALQIESSKHSLNNSSVSGSVTGYLTSISSDAGDNIGGLVGELRVNHGGTLNIENSYATANVNGEDSLGGLIGSLQAGDDNNYSAPVGSFSNSYGNTVMIKNSYATGNVTGAEYGDELGGLVGELRAVDNSTVSIENSYATGNVTGDDELGGLVGYLQSDYSNVVIKDSYAEGVITGEDSLGGLVGELDANDNSTVSIENSYATGNVTGDDELGGLVGYLQAEHSNVVIKNSYAQGVITGDYTLGGLVGELDANSGSIVTLENSHATGDVIGDGYYLGGLVGELDARYGSNVTIKNSHATGNVTGDDDEIGGLIGDLYANDNSTVTIENSYATGDVTGDDELGGLVGSLRAYRSSNVVIKDSHATGNVTGDYDEIGGLVGQLYAEVNSTVSIENSYATGHVSGDEELGGLVGYLRSYSGSNVLIKDSHATGSVTGDDDGIGGLIGDLYANDNSTVSIENSYATGDVIGEDELGGLIGRLSLDSYDYGYGGATSVTIKNSYATGNVTGTENEIGGLIGDLDANYDGRVLIENSYATGNVTGSHDVGGLIGELNADDTGVVHIKNSYAAGNVTGTGADTTSAEIDVGGLIGELNSYNGEIIIDNSYAVGRVTGKENTAGFVGAMYLAGDGTVEINNSFWDRQSSGQSTGVGSQNFDSPQGTITLNNLSGKTTAQMQDIATYTTGGAAWDIAQDTTYSGNYFYPRLSMQDGKPVWLIRPQASSAPMTAAISSAQQDAAQLPLMFRKHSQGIEQSGHTDFSFVNVADDSGVTPVAGRSRPDVMNVFVVRGGINMGDDNDNQR